MFADYHYIGWSDKFISINFEISHKSYFLSSLAFVPVHCSAYVPPTTGDKSRLGPFWKLNCFTKKKKGSFLNNFTITIEMIIKKVISFLNNFTITINDNN